MRKIFAVLLGVITCAVCFTACSMTQVKEISCVEIIKAYEDAGYYVTHGEHKDQNESAQLCYIKANLTENSDSDYIYFITCFTEEQAEEQAKIDKYNLLVWFFGTISGESRWLNTGTYGKIEYSYYNPKLIEPFNRLIAD